MPVVQQPAVQRVVQRGHREADDLGSIGGLVGPHGLEARQLCGVAPCQGAGCQRRFLASQAVLPAGMLVEFTLLTAFACPALWRVAQQFCLQACHWCSGVWLRLHARRCDVQLCQVAYKHASFEPCPVYSACSAICLGGQAAWPASMAVSPCTCPVTLHTQTSTRIAPNPSNQPPDNALSQAQRSSAPPSPISELFPAWCELLS